MLVPLDYETPSRPHRRVITVDDRARELALIAAFCCLTVFLPLPRTDFMDNVTYPHIRNAISNISADEDRKWCANELTRRIHLRDRQPGPPPGVYVQKVPPRGARVVLPFVFGGYVLICIVVFLGAGVGAVWFRAAPIVLRIGSIALMSASAIMMATILVYGWIGLAQSGSLCMSLLLHAAVSCRAWFLMRQARVVEQ